MQNKDVDVLVIGEGAAGLAAALAAKESGASVALIYNSEPSSTAISTGFLTFAGHSEFNDDDLFDAMFKTTGKEICDLDMLTRLINEAPAELEGTFDSYAIPVDPAPRGFRVRRSIGNTGLDLIPGEYAETDQVKSDMTGLMMEFSSTHGTALFSQLRKAARTSDIERIKGTVLSISKDRVAHVLLKDGKAHSGERLAITAGAVIIATGGMQGIFAVTDTPANLLGEGQGMALEVGAELVDMEFVQFYPLAVHKEGVPTLFLYPDFPPSARLINSDEENLIEKYVGKGASRLADLHNWDLLSAVIQREINEGQSIFVDFGDTDPSEWAPDSLTATFLSKYFEGYKTGRIPVAPSAHYTIGGIRTDVDGQTAVPGIYAIGEVAGGVHGANRHGGTALVECLTFGRISGRHAAQTAKTLGRGTVDWPEFQRREGMPHVTYDGLLGELRQLCADVLGPSRDASRLEAAAPILAELAERGQYLPVANWDDALLFKRFERLVELAESMRISMLRRTESRGVHTRTDHPDTSADWVRKQVVYRDASGKLAIHDAPIKSATPQEA